MTKESKLVAIGNSTGVVLPKDFLRLLRAEKGDSIFMSEGADGSIRLTAYNPNFEEQMKAAHEVMRKDRDVLRVLAQ